MLIKITFYFLGTILFLFLFWKRLKEDYETNWIFISGISVLIGILFGILVSTFIFHQWWFWLVVAGAVFGLGISIYRFNLRVFETVEAFIFASLSILTLTFLYQFLVNKDPRSMFGVIVLLLLLTLSLFIDQHYKNFSWYRSGRVGFTGMTIMGIFFLLRAFVAVVFPNMLSFVGKSDALISSVFAFSSFLVLFNLARRPS